MNENDYCFVAKDVGALKLGQLDGFLEDSVAMITCFIPAYVPHEKSFDLMLVVQKYSCCCSSFLATFKTFRRWEC